MAFPKTILVPTDFSECANAAMAYALDIAGATGKTKLVLLHTYATPVVAFPTGAVAYLPEIIATIVRNAEEALAAAAARARSAGVPVETSLKNGDPRETILNAIEEFHADLVCLGTHGRRGVARLLIGSVAERIVRTSPVPVLTVHATGS